MIRQQKKSRWIDCHCHLSLEEVSIETAQEMIQIAKENGICRFAFGGYQPAEWSRQTKIAKDSNVEFYFSYGIHPWLLKDLDASVVESMIIDLTQRAPYAHLLGEMGLDQNIENTALQLDVFRRQLELAKRIHKPIVVHAVGLHNELLAELQSETYSGFVHAFSGDWKLATRYLDCGLKLSFDPRSLRKSKDVIQKIDSEDFLLESDAPNKVTKSPLAILDLADKIALLRGKSRDQILDQVAENFDQILEI